MSAASHNMSVHDIGIGPRPGPQRAGGGALPARRDARPAGAALLRVRLDARRAGDVAAQRGRGGAGERAATAGPAPALPTRPARALRLGPGPRVRPRIRLL